MTIFETERLMVREWTEDPGDLERAYDIYRRPETNRWLESPGLPLTEPEEAAVMLRDLARPVRRRTAAGTGSGRSRYGSRVWWSAPS